MQKSRKYTQTELSRTFERGIVKGAGGQVTRKKREKEGQG